MRRANIEKAVLLYASFSRADLSGINFHDQDFTLVKFVGANLRGCGFYHSLLQGTDFRQAKLTGARFGFCRISCTTFAQADLSEAEVGTLLSYSGGTLVWDGSPLFDSTTRWPSGPRGLWMRVEMVGLREPLLWAWWTGFGLGLLSWLLISGRDTAFGVGLVAAVVGLVGKIVYELTKTYGEDDFGPE